MNNAKESKIAMYLAIEYCFPAVFEGDNFRWCKEKGAVNSVGTTAILDIPIKTEDFLKQLGLMEAKGCSQSFIDHLKHARESGAKWVIIVKESINDEESSR